MKIQTGRVAYYFPTEQCLENFTRQYGKQISVFWVMSVVYSENRNNTFSFYNYDNGKYGWQFCGKEYYECMGYTIITKSLQRSE